MSEFINEFIGATEKVLECLSGAVENESEKRKALLGNDLDRVEAMLQNQQATLMRLDNLEKRRMLAQENAGFGKMAADEIEAAVADKEIKEVLTNLFRQLREKSNLLKSLNRSSLDIANMELKLMSGAPTIKSESKSGGLYNSSGRKGTGSIGGTYNGTF